MLRVWSFIVLWTILPGCATASSYDRRAYILAHPHGWVEVTISDPSIPDVPPAGDSDDPWHRPASCGVSVRLNEEPMLHESAYPNGESAPYSAETGFRFPAPVGATALELSYTRCRVADGEVVGLELQAVLLVEEDKTHEIVFNGAELTVRDARPNDVVTLEDVYEAVTGKRSPDQ